jgi:hypothetical protein
MQDIAGQRLLGDTVRGWTPFGNITPAQIKRDGCVILTKDVHSFVCCPKLDGDRRSASRLSRKFPLRCPAHSLHDRFMRPPKLERGDGS